MTRLLQSLALALPLLAIGRAGQISGTVVSAQGGEPLASVELSLSAIQANDGGGSNRGPGGPGGPRPNSGPSARSALDGRFVFDAVEPGDYILGAAKAGYEGSGRIARRVSLTDSAPSASLTLELNRSPALEGRVLDADGDPLADARVELRTWTFSDGRRTLRGVRSAQTDDRGEYRLHNLTPGRYLVYLFPSSLGMQQGGLLYETSPVYYPQGISPAEAASLELAWGAELKGVDFVAPSAGGTLVSGALLREDGSPCQECSISILDAYGASAATTRVADTGRFAVQGLPSAEYVFVGRGPRGAGRAVEKAFLADRRPVELLLRLSVGQTVSGTLSLREVDGGQEVQLDERASVRLLASEATVVGQPAAARIQAGGAFEIPGVHQGVYSVLVSGLPDNSYIGRVRLGGAELADGRLRVASDSPVSGLELIASFDGGAVQGQAVFLDGKSSGPTDGLVFLRPTAPSSPLDREQVAGYRGGDASFQFRGVPPGEYFVFSTRRDAPLWDWADPTLMAALRRRAARIEVRKGETAETSAPYLELP